MQSDWGEKHNARFLSQLKYKNGLIRTIENLSNQSWLFKPKFTYEWKFIDWFGKFIGKITKHCQYRFQWVNSKTLPCNKWAKRKIKVTFKINLWIESKTETLKITGRKEIIINFAKRLLQVDNFLQGYKKALSIISLIEGRIVKF